MKNVCVCCQHYETGFGNMSCLKCKHVANDNFKAGGKCRTCKYDVRIHGICKRCVDHNQHAPNNPITINRKG